MSFSRKKLFPVLIIIFALCASLFSGCGAKIEPQQGDGAGTDNSAAVTPEAQNTEASPEPAQTEATASAEPGGEAENKAASEPVKDDAVHVSSVEEFLDAIAPNAKIVVEPGKYDITAFTDELMMKPSVDDWRENHKYLELRECFDGVEVVVKNAGGMTISGTTEIPEDTEFTIDPRYATVLSFENCDDMLIEYMKFGHTENGSCMGDVLCFSNCADIRLNTLDLFGCGVYGLTATNGCGDISVYNSYIHNCEFGPFDIYNSRGNFVFRKCVMKGSGSGGVFQDIPGATLKFAGCSFGENETNSLYFWNEESVSFENCTWSEITQYPDYGEGYNGYYEEPDYNPDFSALKIAPTDESYLASYIWYGLEDTEEGMPVLNFRYDGTAELTNFHHDTLYPNWRLENEYAGVLEGDGISGSFTLYYNPELEDSNTWLYVKIGDYSMWMFCF